MSLPIFISFKNFKKSVLDQNVLGFPTFPQMAVSVQPTLVQVVLGWRLRKNFFFFSCPQLFTVGSKGGLWHLWQLYRHGDWSPWELVGYPATGPMVSHPALTTDHKGWWAAYTVCSQTHLHFPSVNQLVHDSVAPHSHFCNHWYSNTPPPPSSLPLPLLPSPSLPLPPPSSLSLPLPSLSLPLPSLYLPLSYPFPPPSLLPDPSPTNPPTQ